ncbi:MAG TPA: response regulator [Chloroflexota bacterium]|nr:response regulator [Chloroflexota bacterium]
MVGQPALGRVLVVDDETELMSTLCEMLSAQNYEAVGYTSPKEALDALTEQDFDLLLSDLSMPEMDGIELLRRALELDPLIVPVIMTGQGSVQTAVEAMKSGAFDYLLKPFKISSLLPLLSRCMDVRRLRLENVQLRETLAIHELSKAVAMTLDLNSILNKVADAAVQQCEADEVSIMLPTRDGRELYVAAVRGAQRDHILGQRVPFDRGIAGWVAQHLEPLTLTGEVKDPRFTSAHPRPEIRWAISMPMMVGGKLVGILNVNALQRRAFTLGQVKALSILTTTGAAALEHTGLYLEAREAEARYRSIASRLAAINEFSRAVGSTLDLKSLFGIILHHVSALTECRSCSIAQHDPFSESFHVVAFWERDGGAVVGEPDGAEERVVVQAPSEVGEIRGRSPIVIEDTRQSDQDRVRRFAEQSVLSLVSVPVEINGRLWGILSVGFEEVNAATPDRVEFLGAIASHLAVAIKNAELYSQLQDAYDELHETQRRVVQQERLSALGQMASGIAHDLNNALVPALGFTELLLDRPDGLDDHDKVREYLKLVQTGAQDAAKIVGRLREFYRERKDDEVFAPVSLNVIVEQAVSLTQPRWKDQAQAKGVTIRVVTDLANVPPILASGAELREAVANLIFNAVDAISESGTITLRTRHDGGSVFLDVADTGVGMSEEVRQRCLEPFFSTKGEQGTGLGLPMVYGIVQRHEGNVEIESEEGVGTRFSLEFPVPRGAGAADDDTAPGLQQNQLRVLVVDDEQMVREVVAQYLASDGHTVETASNAADAMQLFSESAFDLVITDRGMPEMTGDQMAGAMKQTHPNIPIILLTGFGDLMRASGDRPSSVDEIVSKPVRIAVLRQSIARLTADRADARARQSD